MSNPRAVYLILESVTDEQGRYIPCIVQEGVAGYCLTDWNYGSDIEAAQKYITALNERMGYSERDVAQIILSTIRPSRSAPGRLDFHVHGHKGHVQIGNDALLIAIEGYGEMCATPGNGQPVLIDLFPVHPEVIVWGDIEQQDPTHVISLAGAKEK